jgi:hypothetical protein
LRRGAPTTTLSRHPERGFFHGVVQFVDGWRFSPNRADGVAMQSVHRNWLRDEVSLQANSLIIEVRFRAKTSRSNLSRLLGFWALNVAGEHNQLYFLLYGAAWLPQQKRQDLNAMRFSSDVISSL